eukprot:TRINITY_DN952_c0_g1_i1.p1 TRINITY_DN952_c0_g1~~TRINITY_DN952_c0_g1_i1.p1  ORF type:complete len:238 (+),score=38.04 TRINITY_DN952_c0_g1_i1:137-850(+)
MQTTTTTSLSVLDSLCPSQNITNSHSDDEDFSDDDDDDDGDLNWDEVKFSKSRENLYNAPEVAIQNTSPPPFWFGREDPDHIRGIINTYFEKLGLTNEVNSCIRRPKPFIGRVQRTRVFDSADQFTTLDSVDIYLRDALPYGLDFKLEVTKHCVTYWNIEDGLPQRTIPLPDHQLESWEDRVIESEKASFLYSLPVYRRPGDFDYLVSDEENSVGYANVPLHKCFSLKVFLAKQSRC